MIAPKNAVTIDILWCDGKHIRGKIEREKEQESDEFTRDSDSPHDLLIGADKHQNIRVRSGLQP